MERPPVVTLCGSTKFYEAFHEAAFELTLGGEIVLMPCVFSHTFEHHAVSPEQAAMLDDLHRRMIDMSDRVLVLNVGGYIGESTRSEIAYAEQRGTPVHYLEPNAEEA